MCRAQGDRARPAGLPGDTASARQGCCLPLNQALALSPDLSQPSDWLPISFCLLQPTSVMVADLTF